MDRHELEKILDKIDNSKILDVKVKEELEKSFIAYAMAVNVSRAIPDVRDGLKPVHRRIIYAMGNNLGLYNDKPFRKSATIVGEVTRMSLLRGKTGSRRGYEKKKADRAVGGEGQ